MAVLAGRGFARKVHDVRVYGRGVLGLPTYFALMMSYAFSVTAFVLPKLFTLPVHVVVSGFDVVGVVGGLAVTTLLTLISYVVFLRRYRGVTKPLTLEGRIAYEVQRRVARVGDVPVKAYVAVEGRVRGAVDGVVRRAREVVEGEGTGDGD
jgi:hypothetical protein